MAPFNVWPKPCIQAFVISIVATAYVLVAPYTKVEESFSIQAVHDFLYLANIREFTCKLVTWINSHNNNQCDYVIDNSTKWDHENFPGVVHRTFFGSFMIYALIKPVHMLNLFPNKFDYQIVSRICLLAWFCYAYYRLNDAISKKNNSISSQIFTLLTISQFHLLFYASRTLPNSFALVFVMLVYSTWINKEWNKLITLAAFTVLVMRFETIILFGCIFFNEIFVSKQLSLSKVLCVGIPSGLFCLLFTFLFDSYLWDTWVWPEGDGILFNIIENKSHQWGTQPFLWYFYSTIPRLLLTSTLFLILVPKYVLNKYFFVALSFVFLYSFLPHKELRFVIYSVPLFNICISNAINKLFNLIDKFSQPKRQSDYKPYALNEAKTSNSNRTLRNRNSVKKQIHPENDLNSFDSCNKQCTYVKIIEFFKTRSMFLFQVFLYAHFVLNFILSLIMLYISSNNYPGGNALSMVNHDIHSNNLVNRFSNATTSVYVCNLAAQTGFTRFLELDGVFYNKDPTFVLDKFKNYDTIYLVLEPNDSSKYFELCSIGSSNHMICKLASPKVYYNCHSIQNITAFDHVDVRNAKVNFSTFLYIYKCLKQT